MAVVLAGAVFASAGMALAGDLAGALDAFGAQRPRVHRPAPAFALNRPDGGRMGLADARGKVVLLHFWATWCAACRHEMPQIEQLWRRYRGKGLLVLGVNADRGNADGVRAFLRESDVSFPTLLDAEGTARNRYAVRALPTSYLIGRDGRIIARVIGERDWSSPAARAMMQALLKPEQGDEP